VDQARYRIGRKQHEPDCTVYDPAETSGGKLRAIHFSHIWIWTFPAAITMAGHRMAQ
jgi:hypothetical protein